MSNLDEGGKEVRKSEDTGHNILEQFDDDELDELHPPVEDVVSRKSIFFEEQDGLLHGEVYNEKERPHWEEGTNTCLLAMIGFSIGLSNIYRFSNLCFEYGGLAFIIPYTFFVVGLAIPLVYLEVIVGQFTQSGMIRAWTRLVPILRGVGWCQTLLPLLVCFYNAAFLAWALHYCVMSLVSKPLPWVGCDNDWNTLDCRDIDLEEEKVTPLQLRASAEYFRGRVQQRWRSKYADNTTIRPRHITNKDEFGIGTNNEELGFPPSLEMILYLLVVYVFLYYFIYHGLRFAGKGIWFTVTGPFVILMILIYRGIILPGGVSIGLKHLLSFPNESWKNLGKMKVWVAAAEQVFYSLGSGAGVHLTLASYNRFTNNVFRDAVAIVVIDTGTSFLSSIIIFIALGNIAFSDGSEMKDIIAQGPDLMFEVCADFWGRLPGGGFFACIFFVMIFFIGFESLVEALTCVKEAIFEAFGPWFDRNGKTRWVFINTVMVIEILVGFVCLSRGGLHVFIALDAFTAGVPFLVCALLLVIGMGWFWGLTELCNAAEAMTGKRPNIFLQISWKFLLPITITIILILQIYEGITATYHDRRETIIFKQGIQTFGIIYAYAPILIIILGIIIHLVRGEESFKTRFLLGITPNYSHKEILEDGICTRSKAQHYFYIYDRPKYGIRATLIVHPEPEEAEEQEQEELKDDENSSRIMAI